MLKKIIKDITRPLRRQIKKHRRNILMRCNPKKYASILFREELGYDINWNNPKDLNEKINWLAFNTDTSEWTRLADKYRVREYVKERGCEEILIPLLGVWNTPDNIDLKELPNEFVLKTNCGYGDVIFVDKNHVEWEKILRQMQKNLNERFGLKTAEPHYLRISPKIIAEEMLKPAYGGITDYKIWCFDGKPFCILTCSNRDFKNHTSIVNLYDLLWNRRDEWVAENEKNSIEVKRPHCLDQMLYYATKLSTGFPQVRVDLYEVDGKIYFGEMTFTAACGRMKSYSQYILNEMGKHVILPDLR